MDLKLLGERQVIVDCDVVRADGGTRCAAITGGYGPGDRHQYLAPARTIESRPAVDGDRRGQRRDRAGAPVLDLDYVEDSGAAVDCNIVGTGDGAFVEIQATAEGKPFDRRNLVELLDLANLGLEALFAAQREAIRAATPS